MSNPKLTTFLILPFAIYLLTFFGCASAPLKKDFTSYAINGVNYYSLVDLCDAKGISWQYDTFSKSVTLNKDSHRINLLVGDNLILVDGSASMLDHPVDIYQGMIVVPDKLKDRLMEMFLKESAPPKKNIPANLKIKKIVIDAGHGGDDPGATGRTGLKEKDVNLDISKRLAGILKEQGLDVILTRSTDVFIPLPDRAEIANKSGADLFVSLHSNANRVKSMNGFETYYVAPAVNDSQRALLSAKNAMLNLDNKCFASRSQDLMAIVWDMIYTNARAESIELARSISHSMDCNLDAKILGIKEARFRVLRDVRMPAVLVEVGFVSNSDEEKMLKNAFYRQKLAESIAQGITDYAQDSTIMEAAQR